MAIGSFSLLNLSSIFFNFSIFLQLILSPIALFIAKLLLYEFTSPIFSRLNNIFLCASFNSNFPVGLGGSVHLGYLTTNSSIGIAINLLTSSSNSLSNSFFAWGVKEQDWVNCLGIILSYPLCLFKLYPFLSSQPKPIFILFLFHPFYLPYLFFTN